MNNDSTLPSAATGHSLPPAAALVDNAQFLRPVKNVLTPHIQSFDWSLLPGKISLYFVA